MAHACCRTEKPQSTLSDKEYEDILQRNKSVSSGAIMRAVQDASEGLSTIVHCKCLYYVYYYSCYSYYSQVFTTCLFL